MQKVLQQVLKLSNASKAAEWLEAESLVLPSAFNLKKDELIEICLHYGNNKQGTPEFWRKMSAACFKFGKDLEPGEHINLFEAFSYAGSQGFLPYAFKRFQFDGFTKATKQFGDLLLDQDPLFNENILRALDDVESEMNKKENPLDEFLEDLKDGTPEQQEERKKVQEFVRKMQEIIKG